MSTEPPSTRCSKCGALRWARSRRMGARRLDVCGAQGPRGSQYIWCGDWSRVGDTQQKGPSRARI